MKKNELKRRMMALSLAGVLSMSMYMPAMAADSSGETEAAETESEAKETQDGELGIKYAKLFNIQYMDNNVKLVTDGEGNELLLVPKDGEIPEGYEGKQVIRTPLEHAMFTSTTHVGLLGALEDDSLYDSIAAVTTDKADWTTPQVIERFENGQITYVSQDHWTSGNIEEITEIKPDFVFSGGGDESGVQLRAQLDEVEIPYAVVSEWMEGSGEGSLEWLKFFGAFYNKDQEANDIFEAKLKKMDDLKASVSDIADEEKPVVAIGMVYDGIVYTQGGDSPTAKQIEDAGGIYALKDLEGEGSVQIGMEEFVDKAKDADILIYSSMITYTPDKAYLEELDPLMAEFKAFQNDQVYVYGKDYYMNSAAVDEKFEDLVAILHPEKMEGYTILHSVKLPDIADNADEGETE